jgi:hypothetical protein
MRNPCSTRIRTCGLTPSVSASDPNTTENRMSNTSNTRKLTNYTTCIMCVESTKCYVDVIRTFDVIHIVELMYILTCLLVNSFVNLR